MTNTKETGHAKNVANFETLITSVESFGRSYNPAREDLTLQSIKALCLNSRQALTGVSVAVSSYAISVDDCQSIFTPLPPLVTRIKNSLKASGTSTLNDESAETIFRQLQGKRAKVKLTEEVLAKQSADEDKKIKQISSAHRSYDSKIENFDKLLILLDSIPQYTPNEEDLKVASLRGLHTGLKTKHTAANSAEIQCKLARIARNEALYTPLTGLVDIAADIKSYVKSVFGATSPYYKQISGIVFRKPSKK